MKYKTKKNMRAIALALPFCAGFLLSQTALYGSVHAASPMSDEDILFGFGGKQIYSESGSNQPIERIVPLENIGNDRQEKTIVENIDPPIVDLPVVDVPIINVQEPRVPILSIPDDDDDYLPPIKKEPVRTAYAPVQAVTDIQSPVPSKAVRPTLDYDPSIIDIEKVADPKRIKKLEDGNYSLNQFVNHALQTNPTVELSRLQSELQKLLYQETEANQDFQVSGFSNVSSEYTSSDANDNRFDNTTRGEAGIRLNRILYSFGVGENQIASSLTTALQAEIEVEEQENTIAFDLATAYLEAIRQRELVEIEKYRLAEHADFLSLVEKARNTDQVLKSQVFLARTGLAQRKQALLEAERQLKQIEYTLERYSDADILVADLKKPIIPIVVLPDEDQFIENGLELSPQIRALVKAVKAAEYSYDAARKSKYGSIDLTANLSGDKIMNDSTDPTVSTDASIEYSIPLYTSGAEESRIQQAKVEVQQAKANLDFAEKALTEQLKLAYYVIESSDEIRKLAKEEEANALRVLESFRGEVQQGGRAFSDIIAQIDAVAAGRNRQISSQISKTIAAYAIMRHQGDLLYHLTKGS
jgi:outer membrane protein TolC